MITKLKGEAGFAMVSKLNKMFNDMDSTKNTMADFKGKEKEAVINNVRVDVQILTSGIWPEQHNLAVRLPPILCNVQVRFEQFYKNKYNGRNLNWQN